MRFLSLEWVDALDRAAREAGAWAGPPLVLEQVVRDTPDGDVRFHLVLDAGGIRVAGGEAERPDVTLSSDFATAVRIARGTANVQRALAAGRCRLHGDLELLARSADALVALGDLFRSVRVATVFPDPS